MATRRQPTAWWWPLVGTQITKSCSLSLHWINCRMVFHLSHSIFLSVYLFQSKFPHIPWKLIKSKDLIPLHTVTLMRHSYGHTGILVTSLQSTSKSFGKAPKRRFGVDCLFDRQLPLHHHKHRWHRYYEPQSILLSLWLTSSFFRSDCVDLVGCA